jgi:hypothetical protein
MNKNGIGLLLFLLLAFLVHGYRDGAPVLLVATHEIPYGNQIQASDIRFVNEHWYTSSYRMESLSASVIGHITVRNIHKGERVMNPGDVLPFAGPVPSGGLSRQQIDRLRN